MNAARIFSPWASRWCLEYSIWRPAGTTDLPGAPAGVAACSAGYRLKAEVMVGKEAARPSVLRYRASAPIGSQAGSTIGGVSSAACNSAGSTERRAAISKTYSSNHESFIV